MARIAGNVPFVVYGLEHLRRPEQRGFSVPHRTGTELTELRLSDLVHFHISKVLYFSFIAMRGAPQGIP